MKKSVVRLSILKQKAKQIKKAKSLKQHQALDEAAISFGYTNYKNYTNEARINRASEELAQLEATDMLSEQRQDEINKRLLLANSAIHEFDLSIPKLIETLGRSPKSEDDIRAICETEFFVRDFLRLYMLKDALEDESLDLKDHSPHHVPKVIALKELTYEQREDALYVEGNYDLTLEFAFDYDKGDPHPAFKDEELFGSFELTIDKDRKVNFENMDFGYNW